MNDKRLRNLLDVLGTCIQRLSETLATPPEDQRDLAGIIKHFEIVFEQAYKCLVELLLASGEEEAPRSVKFVFRRAFEIGWITDERAYSAMIRDRNATSHTYNADFARDLVASISNIYLPLFHDLQAMIERESARLANE